MTKFCIAILFVKKFSINMIASKFQQYRCLLLYCIDYLLSKKQCSLIQPLEKFALTDKKQGSEHRFLQRFLPCFELQFVLVSLLK